MTTEDDEDLLEEFSDSDDEDSLDDIFGPNTDGDEVDGVGQTDDGYIAQEQSWAVISSYFREKGLVRQQIDSFDSFVNTTLAEVITNNRAIEHKRERHTKWVTWKMLTSPSKYHLPIHKFGNPSRKMNMEISRLSTHTKPDFDK